MSPSPDIEGGDERGIFPYSGLSSLISPLYVVDGANQPHGESDFQDGSSPLFSMYSGITKEEDNKTTERWQKDADVILIFVSPVFRYSFDTS